MEAQGKVHEVEWTEGRIRDFWDFASGQPNWQEDYFSYQVGEGVLNLMGRFAKLQGEVLDYGCGPGYLAERMLQRGVACRGADASPASVAAANARLSSHAAWRGARVIDSELVQELEGTMDRLFCLETLEHLLPPTREATLANLHRLLRAGSGRLMLSTPHDEDLRRSLVFCPECGGVFHRYQHLAGFSVENLIELMESHGFVTLACGATDFTRFQEPLLLGPLEWSPRYVLRSLLRAGAALGDALRLPGRPPGGLLYHRRVKSGPHLFWIGGKA